MDFTTRCSLKVAKDFSKIGIQQELLNIKKYKAALVDVNEKKNPLASYIQGNIDSCMDKISEYKKRIQNCNKKLA